jgi:hypothetical protein
MLLAKAKRELGQFGPIRMSEIGVNIGRIWLDVWPGRILLYHRGRLDIHGLPMWEIFI